MIAKGIPQNRQGEHISDDPPTSEGLDSFRTEPPRTFTKEQREELDKIGRMILYDSVLNLPSGARFTYRHDMNFTLADIDFIIAYFQLRRLYIRDEQPEANPK